MLFVDQLHFSYGDKKILQDLSFSAKEGEIIGLIGVSGSGKTTLFRLITGLIEPNEGKIVINEKAVPEGAQLTTYMRQEDLLLPWRTVLGNLLLFTELGKKQPKNLDLAYALLKRVGLDGYEDVYPHQLSGGMRQRVALARALLQDRPLMLLDEPFASLDVIIREQLYTLLREIRDQYQKTIVMVTHDFRDAMALADRILVLSNGSIVDSLTLTSETRNDPELANELVQQIRAALV